MPCTLSQTAEESALIFALAVASQLNKYVVANDLLRCYQSAYQKRQSREIAMLRV